MEEAELGLVIRCFIAENGGAENLLRILDVEWGRDMKILDRRKWSDSERKYIQENYNDKTCDYIARKLNRTYYSTRKKIYDMQVKSLINYKFSG